MRRFYSGSKAKYPQMHTDVSKWRALMQEGRPVSEKVDTIFRVVCADNPAFWNPTESRVQVICAKWPPVLKEHAKIQIRFYVELLWK